MFRRLCLIAMAVTGPATAGNPPGWWTAEPSPAIQIGVPANNFGVANVGQLKFMAYRAKAHLDATLPGGAGTEINALVAGFDPKPNPAVPYTAAQLATIKRINHGPVTFKHLKSVAKKFYDRLKAAGYNPRDSLKNFGYPSDWTSEYPFGPGSPSAADFAPATIGQLKMVFSFNATGLAADDADGDGLNDAWEISNFGSTVLGFSDDSDFDGISNGAEQLAGSSPGTSPDSDWDGVSDVQETTSDGTDPLDSSDFEARRLAYFPLDAANFVSAESHLPRSSAGVSSVAGWKGNAARIDDLGDVLNYHWKRSDGSPNFSFKRGAVRLWIKPDWNSTQMSGTWSRLFEVGSHWGSGKAWTQVRLHAALPTMNFNSNDGFGHEFGYETGIPFASRAGNWHQIVVNYSPTERSFYFDGRRIGLDVTPWPWLPKLADIVAGGITLGNQSGGGGQPIYGAIDEVEFFNQELPESEIQANLKLDPTDSDLDGISNAQEAIDGTNANDSAEFVGRRIAYFSLDNPNFVSEQGQLPRLVAGVTSVPGKKGNAARIDGNGEVLNYDWKRADGSPNFSYLRGTVRLWIRPDWNSSTMSQTYSRLFQVGELWGTGKAYSMLHFHATAPRLFIADSDGFGHYAGLETTTHFTWAATTWHQVVLTYSSTGRKIYVDGVLVGQTSAPWVHLPKVNELAAGGLTLGNELAGFQPIYGAIDEVEFFNYELSAENVSEDYSYIVDGGVDLDGLPDEWEEFYFGPNGALPGDNADGDAFTNRQEYLAGTDPTKADTDEDGINDDLETTTSAARADSDQDLMPDKWEQINGPSPTVDNRSEDPEPDGMGRTLEHLSGRSSTAPDSKTDISDRALDIFSAY